LKEGTSKVLKGPALLSVYQVIRIRTSTEKKLRFINLTGQYGIKEKMDSSYFILPSSLLKIKFISMTLIHQGHKPVTVIQ